MKKKEIKTGLVKHVCGKGPMKSRGVGGWKVAIRVRGKIIKMASQQKNERDLIIYTDQMLYSEKLIFNIRVWKKVRNVADMGFNWAFILQ